MIFLWMLLLDEREVWIRSQSYLSYCDVISVFLNSRSSLWNNNWKKEEKENDVLNSKERRSAQQDAVLMYHPLIFLNTKFLNIWASLIFSFSFPVNSLFSLCIRIWSSWAADLWGGSQDASIPEEDTHPYWCSGCGPQKPEEQADCIKPTALWHHCTL